MKNLFYLFLVVALAFGLTSCEKEEIVLQNNQNENAINIKSFAIGMSLEEIELDYTDGDKVAEYISMARSEYRNSKSNFNIKSAFDNLGNIEEDINLYVALLVAKDMKIDEILLPEDQKEIAIKLSKEAKLEIGEDMTRQAKWEWKYMNRTKQCRWSGCGPWYSKITKYYHERYFGCSGSYSNASSWKCSKLICN